MGAVDAAYAHPALVAAVAAAAGAGNAASLSSSWLGAGGAAPVAAVQAAAAPQEQQELLSPGAQHMRQLTRLALGMRAAPAACAAGLPVGLPDVDACFADALMDERLDVLPAAPELGA